MIRLARIPGSFAVARLPPDAPIPAWVGGALTSITRTVDELSVVCEEARVPSAVDAVRDFAVCRVVGTIDFAVVGLMASLTRVIAEAGVSVLVISTFDTDYLLVRARDWPSAAAALASVAVLVDERQ